MNREHANGVMRYQLDQGEIDTLITKGVLTQKQVFQAQLQYNVQSGSMNALYAYEVEIPFRQYRRLESKFKQFGLEIHESKLN